MGFPLFLSLRGRLRFARGDSAKDEFGVILPKADHALADKKARALAKLLTTQPFLWQGSVRTLGMAYGVHTFAKGDDPEKVIAAADKAMYVVKRAK